MVTVLSHNTISVIRLSFQASKSQRDPLTSSLTSESLGQKSEWGLRENTLQTPPPECLKMVMWSWHPSLASTWPHKLPQHSSFHLSLLWGAPMFPFKLTTIQKLLLPKSAKRGQADLQPHVSAGSYQALWKVHFQLCSSQSSSGYYFF